jgi:hypothetical protein
VGHRDSDYATIYLDLERHYLQVLRWQQVDFDEDASEVHLLHTHIALVVWGCMLIESLTNRLLLQTLRAQGLPAEVLEDYWRRLERDRTIDKLKALRRHLPIEIPDWLATEIKVRNRLIHAQENRAVVHLKPHRDAWIDRGSPGEFLEHIPPCGIHAELLTTSAAERQARAIEFGESLMRHVDVGQRSRGHHPDVDGDD